MSRILKKKFSIFLILSLFILLYRLPYIYVPLDRDEGGYSYLGWLWTTGKAIPYLQSYDHKFPPVFLVYGLTSLLGGNNFISIRIMSFVYFFLIFTIFYFLCLKLTSRPASFLATFLMVIYLSSIRLQGGHFNTEMLYILPLIFFTLLVWKLKTENRINFVSVAILGLLGSLTSLFKPVAILTVGGILIWLLCFYKHSRINLVIYLIVGFLLPIILILLYFYQYHAIPSLIENLVYYNQLYNRAGLKILTLSTQDGGGFLAIINWLKMLPPVIQPLFILSIAILFKYRKSKTYLWWIGLIHVSSSWLGAKLGGTREFSHYYLPMVLGLSFSSLLLFDRLINKQKGVVAILITLFLTGWVVLPEFQVLRGGSLAILRGEFGGEGDWFYDATKVSSWILNNTDKEDSLLVWANEPEIYFYSHRKSLTEHINFYSFSYRPRSVEEKWLRGVKNFPPDWIITYINDPPSYKELNQLFPGMTGYTKMENVGTYMIFHRIK